MDEQQEAIRKQLEDLRAQSDVLAIEERQAHRHLAIVNKEFETAMEAYRSILTRKSKVEKDIERLLKKDTRRYTLAQKSQQPMKS